MLAGAVNCNNFYNDIEHVRQTNRWFFFPLTDSQSRRLLPVGALLYLDVQQFQLKWPLCLHRVIRLNWIQSAFSKHNKVIF